MRKRCNWLSIAMVVVFCTLCFLPMVGTNAEAVSPLGRISGDTYTNDFFGFKIVNNGYGVFSSEEDVAEMTGVSLQTYRNQKKNYIQELEYGQRITDFNFSDFLSGSIKVSVLKSIDGYSIEELTQLTLELLKESMKSVGNNVVFARESKTYVAGKEAYGYIYALEYSGQTVYGGQYYLEKDPYICMIDMTSFMGTEEEGPVTFIGDTIYPAETDTVNLDDVGQAIDLLWNQRLVGEWKGVGDCFGWETYEFDTNKKQFIFKFYSDLIPNGEIKLHNYDVYDRNVIRIDGLRTEDSNPATLTWRNGYLELSFQDDSQNSGYYYLVKVN